MGLLKMNDKTKGLRKAKKIEKETIVSKKELQKEDKLFKKLAGKLKRLVKR